MSSLAKIMNAEIRRLARREANALVEPLHKAITQLRREIWRLNRDNRALDKKIQHGPRKTTGLPVVDAEAAATGKIGPRLIVKLRARLGLSQGEFAALLDISTNSISNWETGHSRPNAEMRAKLVAARQLGRRDVKRLLKEKADAATPATKPPSKPGKPVAATKGVKKIAQKATPKKVKAPKKAPTKKAAETTPAEPAAAAKAPEVKAPSGKRGRK